MMRIRYEMVTMLRREYFMRNGRLKLIDVGDAVAVSATKAFEFPEDWPADLEVTEVVNLRGFRRAAEVKAKIVLTIETKEFPHIREEYLRLRPNARLDEIPILEYEKLVFEFFKTVLKDIYGPGFTEISIWDECGGYGERVLFDSRKPLSTAEELKRREENRARAMLLGSDVFDCGISGILIKDSTS